MTLSRDPLSEVGTCMPTELPVVSLIPSLHWERGYPVVMSGPDCCKESLPRTAFNTIVLYGDCFSPNQ